MRNERTYRIMNGGARRVAAVFKQAAGSGLCLAAIERVDETITVDGLVYRLDAEEVGS